MTPVTREIEGLALLVLDELYAQRTESFKKLRNDDLLIPSCCLNVNSDLKLNTKELSYSPTIGRLERKWPGFAKPRPH